MVGLPPLKSRSATATLVTLQREPPLTSIFAPGRAAESSSRMECDGFSRRAKMAVARPAAPAPTIATSQIRSSTGCSCYSGELAEGPTRRSSSAAVLRRGAPPSFSFKPAVKFHPAIVDLLGGGKAFDLDRSCRVGDHDFVARPIGLRSHFTLNGLVAALEEVKHAPDYCTALDAAREHESGQIWPGYASVDAYSS